LSRASPTKAAKRVVLTEWFHRHCGIVETSLRDMARIDNPAFDQ
jgi:hypothetical protein